MTIMKSIGIVLAGIALLLVGFALGVSRAPSIERAYPTSRFVEDRMAECALTVRLHGHAKANGDQSLESLVAGDLVGCGMLVETHANQIHERDRDTAERIMAALGPDFASR